MSDTDPTERMRQLLNQLQEALSDLETGKLDLAGLEQASENAGALFERLVVLRHKAREARHESTATNASLPGKEATTALGGTMPSLRLDTRPLEVPARQTSLIDAIAETETNPPKAPRTTPEVPAAVAAEPKPSVPDTGGPAKPKAKPAKSPETPTTKTATLADKLEHAPVADLHKAIALSQKFWFVAELFAGQRERYEKAIDGINALKSLEEARTYVKAEVLDKATKPPAADALQAFIELVERRFK